MGGPVALRAGKCTPGQTGQCRGRYCADPRSVSADQQPAEAERPAFLRLAHPELAVRRFERPGPARVTRDSESDCEAD